jgi:hypothetical protein
MHFVGFWHFATYCVARSYYCSKFSRARAPLGLSNEFRIRPRNASGAVTAIEMRQRARLTPTTELPLSLAIFAGSGDRLFGGHDFLLCGTHANPGIAR